MQTVFLLTQRADEGIDLPDQVVGVFSTREKVEDYIEKAFDKIITDGIVEVKDYEDADDYFFVESIPFDLEV